MKNLFLGAVALIALGTSCTKSNLVNVDPNLTASEAVIAEAKVAGESGWFFVAGADDGIDYNCDAAGNDCIGAVTLEFDCLNFDDLRLCGLNLTNILSNVVVGDISADAHEFATNHDFLTQFIPHYLVKGVQESIYTVEVYGLEVENPAIVYVAFSDAIKGNIVKVAQIKL